MLLLPFYCIHLFTLGMQRFPNTHIYNCPELWEIEFVVEN